MTMTSKLRAQIRVLLQDRDVRHVLHFTQIANLDGIVEHGLLSRRALYECDHLGRASDYHRLDGDEEAVSVSISRVNEAMFAAKRRKSGHSHWAVLVLSSSLLWELECRFSWCNAARSEITGHRGFRGGPWALSHMFEGGCEARQGLTPRMPTDPEAEVQVLQAIGPHFILGAVVERVDLANDVRARLARLPGPLRQVVVDTF